MLGIALHLKAIAPLAAEQLDGGLVGGKLVRRQQINGRHFLQRALAVDVEQAQAVDFIVKEIKAVGLIATHREQVEERAASGIFAVLHHLIDMAVASPLQLIAQRIARQALALFHHQRVAVKEAVRTDALHQGADRDDQHAALHGG